VISGTAKFSECGSYRYELTRSWDATKPELVVVMLNPSTADAAVDDHTIRRVRGFAEAWGYGEARVLNLFALRAREPGVLRYHWKPIGPENTKHLRDALQAAAAAKRPVLAAWGTNGWIWNRAFHVVHMVEGVSWICLGKTKDGSPKHPLYVARSTRPQVYGPFAKPGADAAPKE
jgi:hypothetical protein